MLLNVIQVMFLLNEVYLEIPLQSDGFHGGGLVAWNSGHEIVRTWDLRPCYRCGAYISLSAAICAVLMCRYAEAVGIGTDDFAADDGEGGGVEY